MNHRRKGPVTQEWMLMFREIDPVRGCWNWTRKKSGGGYAQIESDGKNKYVHRWAFELWKGPIPSGLKVLHTCDNPACFNPDHLFVGTQRDNILDAIEKGRKTFGSGEEANGHKLTNAQVLAIRSSTQKISDLAKQFGIDRTNVWNIRTGKTWKHLPI